LFVTDAFAPPDAADRETASGVLGLRVRGDEGGRVLWFRGEVLRTVSWGGNPHKPVEVAAGDGETRARLRPRASFAAWRETVRGRSRPWRSWEVDAASELGRALTEILDLRVARRQAVRDPLTGLPNRAAFGRRLDEGLQRLAREPQRGVGVLFVDVDRFKEINDTLGHLAGDQVLVTAAQRLHHAVRSTDTVARYAGDEFVILSEGIADACVLQELAERLLAQFREPIRLDGHDHVVTVSVGYATAAPGATAEEVLRRADGAMYDAKRSGRGVAAGDSAPDGAPLRFGRAASGGPAEPASDPAQGG
jgi:diguanylate cyclase (GGDEF)-like protein